MMSLETIQRLAGELAEAGTDLVELSGKGDPITHPQLTEILRALAGAGLRIAVVTNGTLAAAGPRAGAGGHRPGPAERVPERRMPRCLPAVQSPGSLGSSDRVPRTRCSRSGERRASHLPHVRLTHVVSKENVDDVEGMVAICEKLHVDEVSFYVMGELPQTRHLQLDVDQALGIRERIPAWSRRLDAAGVRHDLARLRPRPRSARPAGRMHPGPGEPAAASPSLLRRMDVLRDRAGRRGRAVLLLRRGEARKRRRPELR